MDKKLKITFEIGEEKIIVETDADTISAIDSSIEKVKSIAKLLVKDSKITAKSNSKPGPKPKNRKPAQAVVGTIERKKPGPKSGRKAKTAKKIITKAITAGSAE